MSASNEDELPENVPRQIIALEERLAYQQHLLDQLNGVVLQQGGEIDRLSRELAALRDSLNELNTGENLPYEKPPHY